MTTPHRLPTFAAALAAAALAACSSIPLDGDTTGSPAATSATTAAAAADGPGRDWSAIDTDRDNLVSPAEMERWLAANPGPQR